MQTLNIAAYKFTQLSDLPELRARLLNTCESEGLLGTILLSPEGINLMLAGNTGHIREFQKSIARDSRFSDLNYKESYSTRTPYGKLLVKIKPEIIAFGKPVETDDSSATHIPPATLKQWLDEGRKITLLDTRNDYEVRLGAFENACDLNIRHFRELPDAIEKQDIPARDTPIVMYCTGGIRCEKALPYLRSIGYTEVYQLDGGILNYFAETGGEHWQGECFVFDERVGLDTALDETGAVLCDNCQSAVTTSQQESEDYVQGLHCPHCIKKQCR